MNQKVVILLSTYNGEKYLKDQLDSLLKQTYHNISIFVRDDGSTDKTIDILNTYQSKGKLTWYSGDNLKPAKSFMDLIYKAPKSDYYAFCDQDDIWLEDKIEIAISKLKDFDRKIPALYYGRPRLVDANLNAIKNPKSSLHAMLSYPESIVNSNATGCTMVFNYALLKIIQSKKPDFIFMHDIWLHKVCLIAKGNLYFDKDVHILYRQHGNNVIGISNSLWKKIKNKFSRIKTKEKNRSKVIKSLYENYKDIMNSYDKKISLLVINYEKSFANRLKLLFCFNIKTKYFLRNLYFRLAVLLNLF